MTGLLKDLMHDRADALTPTAYDVDAIVRDGQRRVRRRRTAVGALAAAAVVAAAASTPTLLDLRSTTPEGTDAAGPGESAPLTWSQGSVIHTDGRQLDVGRPVHAFVQTSAGFVVVDPEGTVWSIVDGQVTEAGRTLKAHRTHLVADGSWAGWGDPAGKFVFLDQASGRTLSEPATRVSQAEEPQFLQVRSIDGTDAYVHDGRGNVVIDLASGAARPLGGPTARVYDAEGGRLLFGTTTRREGDLTWWGRVTEPGGALPVRGGDVSPGAAYVMSENSADSSDDFTLATLPDGTPVEVEAAADYPFFVGYAWIDDERFSAFGIQDLEAAPYVLDLLVCDAGTGACSVEVEDLAWRGFQLPVGEHLDSE